MKHAYLFVLYIAIAFAIDLVTPQTIYAQDPATAVQAQAAAAAPVIAVQAAAVQAPAVVVVPEPAAPPQWATDVLMAASKLPVIGPIVSKGMLYLGILAAILTTLVGAILAILAALGGAFKSTGMDNAAAVIQAFKDGKVMYWLKFFSNFNAKKPQ